MRNKAQTSRFWQYMLLLNMALPAWFVLQEPAAEQIAGLVLLAVIVALHVIGIERGGKRMVVIISLQLAAAAALGFAFHPMYMYLVFLVAYAYTKLNLRQLAVLAAGSAVAIIGMMAASGYAANMQMWFNMLPPIFGCCVLPFVIHASGRYRETAERLQAATSEIERLAQQAERQRIAQELHDTLGHTLSLLALKGELIEKLIPRAPERAAGEAREVRETASAALRRMRELVSDMKVVRLDEEWTHARMLCAAANVRLDIRNGLPEAGIALTPLQESVIGMCVREAITNVVRHSRADVCRVELTGGRDFIRCTVEDNGEGFHAAAAGPAGSVPAAASGGEEAAAASADGTGKSRPAGVGGNGMIGMKQRLALLEGTLSIEPVRGGGTRLVMDIPVVRRDRGIAGGGAE